MQRQSLYKCKSQRQTKKNNTFHRSFSFFFSHNSNHMTTSNTDDRAETGSCQIKTTGMSLSCRVCCTAARVKKTKNQRQWQSKRQSCAPALSSPRKTSQLWTDGRRSGTECAVVTVPQPGWGCCTLHCCFFHTLSTDLPVGSTFSQSDGRFRRKSSQQ